jgi:hypothetical protein
MKGMELLPLCAFIQDWTFWTYSGWAVLCFVVSLFLFGGSKKTETLGVLGVLASIVLLAAGILFLPYNWLFGGDNEAQSKPAVTVAKVKYPGGNSPEKPPVDELPKTPQPRPIEQSVQSTADERENARGEEKIEDPSTELENQYKANIRNLYEIQEELFGLVLGPANVNYYVEKAHQLVRNAGRLDDLELKAVSLTTATGMLYRSSKWMEEQIGKEFHSFEINGNMVSSDGGLMVSAWAIYGEANAVHDILDKENPGIWELPDEGVPFGLTEAKRSTLALQLEAAIILMNEKVSRCLQKELKHQVFNDGYRKVYGIYSDGANAGQ